MEKRLTHAGSFKEAQADGDFDGGDFDDIPSQSCLQWCSRGFQATEHTNSTMVDLSRIDF